MVVGSDEGGAIARYTANSPAVIHFGETRNVLHFLHELEGMTVWIHVSLNCAQKVLPALYLAVTTARINTTLWVVVQHRP